MTENEAINFLMETHYSNIEYVAIYEVYPDGHSFELDQAILIAVKAIEEIQQYREIGTVEECREAVDKQKKCEKQWHDDMRNPLEPIKVYSALNSEIMKLELRLKTKPKDVNVLDYTVIAALQKVLNDNLEGAEE